MTLHVKSPIFRTKAEYEGCAAWNAPRGVSSLHVLVRAFGDAYMRRENVRHATLLFCAFGGWVLVLAKARENRWRYLRGNGSTEQQFAINRERQFFMKLSSSNTTVVVFAAMMLIMMANLIISIHLSIKCKQIEKDNGYEISDVDDKVSRLEASITDIESSLSKLKSNVSDLESELDDIKTKVDDTKSDVDDLDSRMDSLELKNLQSALGKSDSESRISDIESSVSRLKLSMSDIESDVSNLKREIDLRNLRSASPFNSSPSYSPLFP